MATFGKFTGAFLIICRELKGATGGVTASTTTRLWILLISSTSQLTLLNNIRSLLSPIKSGT